MEQIAEEADMPKKLSIITIRKMKRLSAIILREHLLLKIQLGCPIRNTGDTRAE
jgi:hypothetical protein